MARITGTVKWFNDAKGFGFITPENGEKDCFVHHTAIQADGFRCLAYGQRVEVEGVQGAKGPAGQNVIKLYRPRDNTEENGGPSLTRWPAVFVPETVVLLEPHRAALPRRRLLRPQDDPHGLRFQIDLPEPDPRPDEDLVIGHRKRF